MLRSQGVVFLFCIQQILKRNILENLKISREVKTRPHFVLTHPPGIPLRRGEAAGRPVPLRLFTRPAERCPAPEANGGHPVLLTSLSSDQANLRNQDGEPGSEVVLPFLKAKTLRRAEGT